MEKINAKVSVKGKKRAVTIPVSSSHKPEIAEPIQNKWQNIIDVLAQCLYVPAGLIMQLDEGSISVFLSSTTSGNPYNQGDSESLQKGLYCETVVGTGRHLLIPDATKSRLWDTNPDIALGMISYLGFPLKWPDGDIFGTLCVLDEKENAYSKSYINLMKIMKETIENDLAAILSNYQELQKADAKLHDSVALLEETNTVLKKTVEDKNILLSEIHHRVKNNLQIISSLVELQLHSLDNDLPHDGLKNIQNRIQSMGIVHEILYNSDDYKTVKMHKYFERLIKNLQISLLKKGDNIRYRILIDKRLRVNLDTAIPIGLLSNEIITNSIKHGFDDQKKGEINISLHEEADGEYHLNLSDNGKGFSESQKEKTGLGRELITLLVLQLNGTCTVSSKNGTTYSIVLHKAD